MTDIRTIDIDEGLDALRSELTYTLLRLKANETTRDLAAPFEALLARWPAIRDGQLAAWDAEDAADVAIANADDAMDDATALVARDLLAIYQTYEHEQMKRFFGNDTPSAIQRLGVESQASRTAGWGPSLRTQGRTAAADAIEAAQAQASAAVAQRIAAAGARADHRVRVIQALFDDANALRRSTFGTLVTRGASANRPASWAARPFRRGRRRRPTPE